MSSFSAVTIGSMHVCSLCTGQVPHVGGPVVGPGAVGIYHNNKPAAVVGDLCTCVGAAPAAIVQGQPGIFHGGVPAVALNGLTSHGGTFATGVPNIIHGAVTDPRKPYVRYKKKVVARENVAVASPPSGIETIQEAVEGARPRVPGKGERQAEKRTRYPRIYNIQWVREKRVVRSSRPFREVTIRAYVHDIDEGEEITITIKLPKLADDTEQDVVRLTGVVKDRKVEVTWEVEGAHLPFASL